MAVAHNIHQKTRTYDVQITENVAFSGLFLSDPVLQGLVSSGFERPSPIQLKAIPLGRCGLDLIVQAKSGTGKTCVFTVVALESLKLESAALQVLVLAPTREIAVQIWDVVTSIGKSLEGLECHTFIGGIPVQQDRQKLRKCHIAIGTPGRIKQLIELEVMKTKNVRMLVLDEADKLLEAGFQEQINWIYSTLPENKQMLALSATYPEYLAEHLTAYMRNPTFLRLNITDPTLLGVKQYFMTVPFHPLPNNSFRLKSEAVVQLLSSVAFQQCLVFSNLQTRARNLAGELKSRGWPTACIAGNLEQTKRLAAMDQLRSYQCRVLISTDLTSRGIDADKVDLIIHLDVPWDHETYLHRTGRAGRYGSFGASVMIASAGQEEEKLKMLEEKCHTHILPIPDPIPTDLILREVPESSSQLVTSEVILTCPASAVRHNSGGFSPSPAPESRARRTTGSPGPIPGTEELLTQSASPARSGHPRGTRASGAVSEELASDSSSLTRRSASRTDLNVNSHALLASEEGTCYSVEGEQTEVNSGKRVSTSSDGSNKVTSSLCESAEVSVECERTCFLGADSTAGNDGTDAGQKDSQTARTDEVTAVDNSLPDAVEHSDRTIHTGDDRGKNSSALVDDRNATKCHHSLEALPAGNGVLGDQGISGMESGMEQKPAPTIPRGDESGKSPTDADAPSLPKAGDSEVTPPTEKLSSQNNPSEPPQVVRGLCVGVTLPEKSAESPFEDVAPRSTQPGNVFASSSQKFSPEAASKVNIFSIPSRRTVREASFGEEPRSELCHQSPSLDLSSLPQFSFAKTYSSHLPSIKSPLPQDASVADDASATTRKRRQIDDGGLETVKKGLSKDLLATNAAPSFAAEAHPSPEEERGASPQPFSAKTRRTKKPKYRKLKENMPVGDVSVGKQHVAPDRKEEKEQPSEDAHEAVQTLDTEEAESLPLPPETTVKQPAGPSRPKEDVSSTSTVGGRNSLTCEDYWVEPPSSASSGREGGKLPKSEKTGLPLSLSETRTDTAAKLQNRKSREDVPRTETSKGRQHIKHDEDCPELPFLKSTSNTVMDLKARKTEKASRGADKKSGMPEKISRQKGEASTTEVPRGRELVVYDEEWFDPPLSDEGAGDFSFSLSKNLKQGKSGLPSSSAKTPLSKTTETHQKQMKAESMTLNPPSGRQIIRYDDDWFEPEVSAPREDDSRSRRSKTANRKNPAKAQKSAPKRNESHRQNRTGQTGDKLNTSKLGNNSSSGQAGKVSGMTLEDAEPLGEKSRGRESTLTILAKDSEMSNKVSSLSQCWVPLRSDLRQKLEILNSPLRSTVHPLIRPQGAESKQKKEKVPDKSAKSDQDAVVQDRSGVQAPLPGEDLENTSASSEPGRVTDRSSWDIGAYRSKPKWVTSELEAAVSEVLESAYASISLQCRLLCSEEIDGSKDVDPRNSKSAAPQQKDANMGTSGRSDSPSSRPPEIPDLSTDSKSGMDYAKSAGSVTDGSVHVSTSQPQYPVLRKAAEAEISNGTVDHVSESTHHAPAATSETPSLSATRDEHSRPEEREDGAVSSLLSAAAHPPCGDDGDDRKQVPSGTNHGNEQQAIEESEGARRVARSQSERTSPSECQDRDSATESAPVAAAVAPQSTSAVRPKSGATKGRHRAVCDRFSLMPFMSRLNDRASLGTIAKKCADFGSSLPQAPLSAAQTTGENSKMSQDQKLGVRTVEKNAEAKKLNSAKHSGGREDRSTPVTLGSQKSSRWSSPVAKKTAVRAGNERETEPRSHRCEFEAASETDSSSSSSSSSSSDWGHHIRNSHFSESMAPQHREPHGTRTCQSRPADPCHRAASARSDLPWTSGYQAQGLNQWNAIQGGSVLPEDQGYSRGDSSAWQYSPSPLGTSRHGQYSCHDENNGVYANDGAYADESYWANVSGLHRQVDESPLPYRSSWKRHGDGSLYQAGSQNPLSHRGWSLWEGGDEDYYHQRHAQQTSDVPQKFLDHDNFGTMGCRNWASGGRYYDSPTYGRWGPGMQGCRGQLCEAWVPEEVQEDPVAWYLHKALQARLSETRRMKLQQQQQQSLQTERDYQSDYISMMVKGAKNGFSQ